MPEIERPNPDPATLPGEPPVVPSPAEPSAPAVDPEEVAFLRTYYANTHDFVDAARPYQDNILTYISDPTARQAAEVAMESAAAYRKRVQAKDPLEEKVDKLVDFVDKTQTANQQAIASYSATNYIRGLAEKHKFLADDGWKAVGDLQREAESFGIKDPMAVAKYIEVTVNRTAPQAAKNTPPASLRGDAGEPGIPGRPEDRPTDPQQIRQWLITQARRANAGG